MGERAEIRKQVMTQTTTLVTTAFGLVAALAWNGAIQALFKDIFGTMTDTTAMFAYAIVVTIIAVLAVFYMSKISARLNK